MKDSKSHVIMTNVARWTTPSHLHVIYRSQDELFEINSILIHVESWYCVWYRVIVVYQCAKTCVMGDMQQTYIHFVSGAVFVVSWLGVLAGVKTWDIAKFLAGSERAP